MGALRGRVAGFSLEPALNRLNDNKALDPEALRVLRRAVLRSETHSPESFLDPHLGEPSRRRILLRGWGARSRALQDGRRQIFSFLVPGDVVGGRTDIAHDAPVALTTVETIEVGALCASLGDHPLWAQSITHACDRAILAQDDLLFDHIVRLGQRNAIERVASLMLELHRRLSAVGLARIDGFDLPLKQEHLAEALGLTLVHINRTLQRMRGERLLDLHAGKASIFDWRRIARLAGEDDSASPEFDAPLRRLQRTAVALSS